MSHQERKIEQQFKHAFIEHYRKIIRSRYQYQKIKAQLPINRAVTKETVDAIRYYFLEYIYPPIHTRNDISLLFLTLKSYVYNPDKIFVLVNSMTTSLLKFGFYLPQAIKGAVSIWRSLTNAQAIENIFVEIAHKNGAKLPMSQKDFLLYMSQIPNETLHNFNKEIYKLLSSFFEVKFLKKTIELLESIIHTMKEKNLSNTEDINAITFGLDIVKRGSEILAPYPKNVQKEIVEIIYEYEKIFIDDLQSSPHVKVS